MLTCASRQGHERGIEPGQGAALYGYLEIKYVFIGGIDQ